MLSPIIVAPSLENNRTLIFSGLPSTDKYELPTLGVTIGYTSDTGSDMLKGIALDNYVIPHVVQAVNAHARLVDTLHKIEVQLSMGICHSDPEMQGVMLASVRDALVSAGFPVPA